MVDLNPIAAELRAPVLNVRHCFGRAALAVARGMLAHAVEQVNVRWKDTPYRLQRMPFGFGAGARKESTEIFPANAIVVKEGLGVVETLDVACRKVRSVAACNALELRRSLAKPFPVREALAQLISPTVSQYNGVGDLHITHDGIFDAKGKPVKDKKTGEPKPAQDPEWMLFEKCMRGDTSDNVFSAYPGVRTKGSKNKVGLMEAFEDRKTRGFNWNNLMLQRWVDHNGVEHRVLEDYQRNVQLCDLTAQPDDIKAIIKETIATHAVPKEVTQVGIRMLKFCNQWDMKKIADNIQTYAEPFQAKYPQGE